MDRQIVYPGSIPLDTDLLLVQRHAMIALGTLARMVLGTVPVADGLGCMPAATGYGVTVGPGSFTGLRVGLAIAKGLALALTRPCVGVGVLEALAASISGAGPTAAVIDAGRGRVYLQLFDAGVSLSGPDILTLDLAAGRLVGVFPSGRMVVTGPGARLLIGAAPFATLDETATPDPRVVAQLAGLAPSAPPRPLYLRPPDAKVKAA